MQVRVLYFASARDTAGRRDENFDLDGAATLARLADMIHEKHPGLKAISKSTRYAVNLEIVEEETALHDGDEIGVLPAVTGG